ncbi:MAG: hypothetical protein JNK84_23075 [Phreatobacter sp.]|uniref:hypothetical protein n=1 Tax=Phreatobacter sp. TaxID=1966341 RepID=UPI001A50E5DA|nr:hypothetical protein [Phreatobacter sp.]MBL8571968.1 hypothetical protein [Phreatobacter sp.]
MIAYRSCVTALLVAAAAPPLWFGTAEAQTNLVGRWAGQATCAGSAPITFDLEIREEGRRLTAVETWRADSSTGSITYAIRTSPDGSVTFVPLSAADIPRSVWRSLQFSMRAIDERRMEGEYAFPGDCSRRTMARAEEAEPRLPAEAAGVIGGWRGILQCGQAASGNDTFLTVSSGAAGRVAATLVSFGPRHFESGPIVVPLVGEWDARQRDLRFAPTERQYRAGMQVSGARAKLANNRLTIALEGSTCTPFEALRISPDRQRPTRTAGPSDGAILRGTSLRARCEALGAWPERLRREFPGVAFDRMSNVGSRIVLAFGDDVFVPAFAVTFDKMSDAQKTEASHHLIQECRRDPLLAQELRDLMSLIRGLSPGHLTSFGQISITYVVETQREVRHELERLARLTAVVESGQIPAPTESLGVLERSKRLLEAHKAMLWPSEAREADRRIAAIEGRLFDHAANIELARIRAEPDPTSRLRALAEVTGGRAQWFSRASPTLRSQAIPALRQEHETASRAAIGPFEQTMAATQRSLEGLRRLEQELTSLQPLLPQLAEPVRKELVAATDAWKADAIGREVRPYLQRLEQTPRGSAEGLRLNGEERRRLEQAFAPYRSVPVVAAALLGYEADRRARLREGLELFGREVTALRQTGTADPVQVKALASSYLTEPEDWRRPIALAYRVLAARLGVPIPD